MGCLLIAGKQSSERSQGDTVYHASFKTCLGGIVGYRNPYVMCEGPYVIWNAPKKSKPESKRTEISGGQR